MKTASKILLSVVLISFFFIGFHSTYAAEDSSGLDFTVHAVVLDGDNVDLVQTAMTNAMNFINTHSRLHLSYSISTSTEPHTLGELPCQSGTCVELRKENLSPNLISSLPIADMYIFFYRTNYRTTGKGPSAAGSTYGIELNVGGTLHSYASIASDPWWFVQELDKRHIVTHETINELDGILFRPPYFCTHMYGHYGDGRTPEQAEGERLGILNENTCYQNVEQYHNPFPIIPPPPPPLPPTPISSCPQLTHNFGSGTTDITAGGEVSKVQQFLISKGYLVMPPNVPPGTFGKLTQGALSAFQVSVGISPAAGYFGSITQTKIRELTCGSSVPPRTSTPPTTSTPPATPRQPLPPIYPNPPSTRSPTSTPTLCSTRGCVSSVFNAIDEVLAQKNTYGLTADVSKALDWLWRNVSEILTGSR